ncbi:cytochrome P450 [Artemisia annua]|uniref:Cytochrome P450 n=1 Tax=Artemisia annua TaxID=35608 RepID=A0A2U1LCN9_ARTAN|nr:cytochrome P450 [Artemisia annua]
MGAPTVVIVGQSGNKFILGSEEDVLIAKQPKTLSTIAGKYNIFELTGPSLVTSFEYSGYGTMAYWHGMRARSRIIDRLIPIIRKKREDLREGRANAGSDILSSLIDVKMRNEDVINEEMIVDNFVTLMIAGHDTSAILLSLMVWKLSKVPEIHQNIFEEQMEIQKEIKGREDQNLTWGDIQKMKYTWRVAQELMRIIPPVFGSFRKVVKDTSFGGFNIPKGWQVFWCAYNTDMDNDIFVNPKDFDPSRFETNGSKPIPPYAYIPFGGGQHSCIGTNLQGWKR